MNCKFLFHSFAKFGWDEDAVYVNIWHSDDNCGSCVCDVADSCYNGC